MRNQKTLLLKIETAKPGDFLLTAPAVISYISIPDSSISKKDFKDISGWISKKTSLDFHRLIDFTNDIGDVEIDGQNIFELFNINGVSYWQFIPSFIQPIMLRAIEITELLKSIISETAPTKIIAKSSSDVAGHIWTKAVKATAINQSVPCDIIHFRRPFKKRIVFEDYKGIRGSGRLFFKRLKYVGLSWTMKIISVMSRSTNHNDLSRDRILMATNERYWTKMPFSKRYYDEQFSQVINSLRSDRLSSSFGVDCTDSFFIRTLASYLKRIVLNKDLIVWKSIYRYWHVNPDKTKVENKQLEHIKDKFFNSSSLTGKFSFSGISLLPILYEDFEFTFNYYLPNVIQKCKVASNIIKIERPKILVVTGEAVGVFERALIIEAGLLNIKTVGLQHGMIFENHVHYMHKAISTNPILNPNGFIRPTKTFVWGNIWKDNLVRAGHYEDKDVDVTGNWRYDEIIKGIGGSNLSQVKNELKIPLNRTVICIISSNQNVVKYLFNCLDNLKKEGNYFIIIKLHPLDNLRAVRNALKNYHELDFLIIVDKLYKVLCVADVIISQPSTVISEAILLQKEIILTKFDYSKGWEKYSESGFCTNLNDLSQLNQVIEIILHDKKKAKSKLRDTRDFIYSYFFKQDLKATERVKDGLYKMMGANK